MTPFGYEVPIALDGTFRRPAEGRQNRVHSQPGRCGCGPDRGAIAAPWPIDGRRNQARAHRVQHHVASHLQQMRFPLHVDRRVPSLQHVTGTAVRSVESLGIAGVELAHSARQVGARRLEQQVIVVGHQAVGVATPSGTLAGLGHEAEETPTVLVVEVYVTSGVAARRHVVESARELDPQRSSHKVKTTRPVDSPGPDASAPVGILRSTFRVRS